MVHCHTHTYTQPHTHDHNHTCSYGCDHGNENHIILRIVLCVASFAAVHAALHFVVSLQRFSAAFYLIPYAIIGYDVLLRAVKNIFHGEIFDENFLMSCATIGALILDEYTKACAVMLFYQTGEMLQDYAVTRSKKSISALMDIRPDYANIKKDGSLLKVTPDTVTVGSTIIVKPGEKVPLDGVVVRGSSFLDTSALTGESVPRQVGEGDEILSGYINQNGLLEIRTTKEFDESTASKILELVENASSKKAKAENFITKFAKYYTPVVVIGAVLLAFVPPLAGSDIPSGGRIC